MPTYAQGTSVPIGKTRAAIDELLRRWRCDAIRWADHFAEGLVRLEFIWTRDGVQYLARLELRLPDDATLRRRARHAQTGAFLDSKYDRLRSECGRQEHRIMLLWLTAAFNAVDAGLVSAETIFLPFLVGRDGQTVAEAALPRLPELLRGAAASILALPESVK